MTYAYSRGGFREDPWFQFARPRSHRDRIARIDALATLLDTAFILPGINVRFGLDALIGLVPGIGDAVVIGIAHSNVLFVVVRQQDEDTCRIISARKATKHEQDRYYAGNQESW